ncbi:MAG: NAD(P)H-hydrate epimerase [Chloroflexi bacterium]|nr:NAD(P)H-hydrate epimerase [Chloroflexota bacterium]
MTDDGLEIPYVSTEQMREVDRLMVEEYGIALIQMMENAGRNLAHLARKRFFGGDARGRRVLVLAGTGGNGGGGLVAARRLHGWGALVEVWVTAQEDRMDEVSGQQLKIVERMSIPVSTVSDAEDAAPGPPPADVELIVDAMIGYSLSGPPRGVTATLIRAANAHPAPVLALDVPSGVDTTTGRVFSPAVRADATLTLALPKEGLRSPAARDLVGELYLADIGVPPGLYDEPSLSLVVGPLFARHDVIRIG